MTSVNAKHEALLDELLKDYTSPQDILGEHGLLKQLTKRVVERVLEAELTAHLGYAPHVRHGTEEPNTRNGKGQKTVQTDTGPLDLAVPRDRNGSFAPQLVPKRQRRLEGFDAKVLEPVCPRALDAGDPGASRRAVRHGGVTDAHLDHHRCGAWMRCARGSRGRSPRCIRSCTLMRCSSNPGRRGRCR